MSNETNNGVKRECLEGRDHPYGDYDFDLVCDAVVAERPAHVEKQHGQLQVNMWISRWFQNFLIIVSVAMTLGESLRAAPDGGVNSRAESKNCEARLLGSTGYALRGDQVVFGSGTIRNYTLTKTLQHLGLQAIEIAKVQGRVLLLGEGLGKLLPAFSRYPMEQLIAVDPLYMFSPEVLGPTGSLVARYVENYRRHLIAASGAALPLPDNSIDQIWSHMLMNNFFLYQPDGSKTYDDVGIQIMSEALRVLKINSRAVFTNKGTWERYEHLLFRPLRRRSGLRGRYLVKKEEFMSVPYEGANESNFVRISIVKVGDKTEPAQIHLVR